MTPVPSVFVSHGSPDLPLRKSPTFNFLKGLGTQLGKPRAILAVSAHWLSPEPLVSTAAAPETIHDFYGFPPEAYEFNYPAPGAPDLAEEVIQRLREAGLPAGSHATRGLDHGAWEPLMLMYPEADIPVTQLSLQPHLGPAYHRQLGQALAPLRQAGVLILTSGSITHNLKELRGHPPDAAPPVWVTEFDQWFDVAIAHHDVEALLNYRQQAPHAARNHPSEEHLLPFFVALGAGETQTGTRLHTGFDYGVLSMAAYAFGG